MAKFKVTIEKTEWVVGFAGKEWKVMGKKPDGSDEYGYTPEIEKTMMRSFDIYEQTVDELDVAEIVAVVNGIKRAPD